MAMLAKWDHNIGSESAGAGAHFGEGSTLVKPTCAKERRLSLWTETDFGRDHVEGSEECMSSVNQSFWRKCQSSSSVRQKGLAGGSFVSQNRDTSTTCKENGPTANQKTGKLFLESQWLITMGYFKPTMVYFGI